MKESPPFDWLALVSSDSFAPVEKASHGAVLITLTDGARRFKKLKWETVLA
jgi:hypothetical protein